MKMLNVLFVCSLLLLSVSCAKDADQDLSLEKVPTIVDDEKERDDSKLAPPCVTDFFVQGLPFGGTVTITRVPANTVVAVLGNGTHYGFNLNKSTSYIISTNGCYGATVHWCSCGNNVASASLTLSSPWALLQTSSNTSPYTLCSF